MKIAVLNLGQRAVDGVLELAACRTGCPVPGRPDRFEGASGHKVLQHCPMGYG